MAEIVQSLFGVTPQMYQQQQANQADARALQFAQLSPFEQANFSIGRGASQLVGALGGQDPQLQMLSRRNQIAQQIDYNNPESIAEGARLLSGAGDSQGAMMLAEVGRKALSEQALVTQRTAAAVASNASAVRERTIATPTTPDITNARAFADSAGALGSPEYNAAFIAKLNEFTTKPKDKGPAFGAEREAVSRELFNVPFENLTQTQQAVVNKRVDDSTKSTARAGATQLVLPGQKELVDVPKFRNTVQATIDPQLKAINSSDQALTALQDSLATNNFASFRAAQVMFARAISGAGDLSQRELNAAGADPALIGGSADYISKLFTSTPTADTQRKMIKTLEAIRTVASAKARTEVEQQRKIALNSPGYNVEAVTQALTFPELAQRPTAGGSGGSIAEQAKAELARRANAGGR